VGCQASGGRSRDRGWPAHLSTSCSFGRGSHNRRWSVSAASECTGTPAWSGRARGARRDPGWSAIGGRGRRGPTGAGIEAAAGIEPSAKRQPRVKSEEVWVSPDLPGCLFPRGIVNDRV